MYSPNPGSPNPEPNPRQASLIEEDAALVQALLQAQQASLQEEEARRAQLAREEEEMLTRVQQL